MKKIFLFFIFFILVTPVSGQRPYPPGTMVPVDEGSGSTQTPPVVEPGQPTVNFEPFPTLDGVPIDEQLPGMPGGGTQNTGVLNNTGILPGSNNQDVTPQSSSAELRQCSSIQFKSLLDILIWIKCIIVVAIIPLIFAAAFVLFLWGVFKFIAASDAPKREEGKKFIVNGLIALFVMVSIWGIISIIGTTLGTKSTVPMLQTTYLKKP